MLLWVGLALVVLWLLGMLVNVGGGVFMLLFIGVGCLVVWVMQRPRSA